MLSNKETCFKFFVGSFLKPSNKLVDDIILLYAFVANNCMLGNIGTEEKTQKIESLFITRKITAKPNKFGNTN